ncbi:MAG: citramalate synthase [Clostridiales bacterium]|nr:citramalate synthase [Clostridiales bacterium]
MKPEKIILFESSLRDGAQARGITFSLPDKLKMVAMLDELGMDYIEAGNPASNPKERAFFEAAAGLPLKNSRLTAFGATCRKQTRPDDDPGVLALLSAGTPAVAIFGKAWDLHVTHVLGATLDENLQMIRDTVAFFKERGREVIFDAEHFFDGYRCNREYALAALEAAADGGAACLTLCDTNGGALPWDVEAAVTDVCGRTAVTVGIHAHNDGELAVANTLTAVRAGARHVQGTLLGFGERCGNARLTSVIPNLELKMGLTAVGAERLSTLSDRALEAADIANLAPDDKLPYVGRDAFAHKGGMHIDGVSKVPRSFEHVEPALVGNRRGFMLSEVAGRSALSLKLQAQFPQLSRDSETTRTLIEKLKELENEGFSYEGAESSFELVVRRHLGLYRPSFELTHYKVMDEPNGMPGSLGAYAVVKVDVRGEQRMAAADGNGPVNALDKALREALSNYFPELSRVSLSDYKVRVLDTRDATAARVRVVIQSTDGRSTWSTLGVSPDVIEASLQALIDSIEYKLLSSGSETV